MVDNAEATSEVVASNARVRIGPSDVVVRGGDMSDEKLQSNAEAHYHDPATKGEWALSVASLPGAESHKIIAASDFIRQRVFRSSQGNDLEGEFEVVTDDPPHALILLDEWPNPETCARLRALFSENQLNPLFDERRTRRNAS